MSNNQTTPSIEENENYKQQQTMAVDDWWRSMEKVNSGVTSIS